MATLVVRWDGYINEFGGGVGIAQGDDGDVDVGGFFNGLGVSSRVGDNDQSWFLEGARDVVGEVSGRETSCNSDGSRVRGEFENSALAIRTGGDDTDIGRVVDCCDDACCKDDFLPVVKSHD